MCKDFEVSVEDDKVSVRSSSRVGDSDFGVNAKRHSLIAQDAAIEWFDKRSRNQDVEI